MRTARAGRPQHHGHRWASPAALVAVLLVAGTAGVTLAAPAIAAPTTTTTPPTTPTTAPPTTAPPTTRATTPTTVAPVVPAAPTTQPPTTTTTAPPVEVASDADVVPVVECSYFDKDSEQYHTVWGYKNETKGKKNDLEIPIGKANSFDNPSEDAGQPVVFKPGTDKNVFVVTHKGESTWTLTSYTATAPGKDCKTNPVPIVSSKWASLVTIGVVTLIAAGILFWRMRRSRRRV